jgi:hypothetical protein
MNIDDGTTFGRETTATSKLLYGYSLPLALDRIQLPTEGKIYDLGGGNGLSKVHFPNHEVVTVDMNPKMNPDIVADIRTFDIPDDAGMVLLRFVMHYMNDLQLSKFLRRLKVPTLVIQFANDNPRLKAQQTAGHEDQRYFRTWENTTWLLGAELSERCSVRVFDNLYRVDYQVTPDFYLERAGRLGISNHGESLGAWWKPKCTK